jgi:putative endonuclease
VEQLVARWAHNPKVTSSSLVPATTKRHESVAFFMVFSAYILYSKNHNTIYVGYSSDAESRSWFHNSVANKGWTKRYQPWIFVHKEDYSPKREAMAREKFLKSGKGREWIWKEIIPKSIDLESQRIFGEN